MGFETPWLRPRRRAAFTLVELLVVIGIIAVLIAVLLPALNKARKSAENVKCASNLHNVGLALMAYAADHKGRYPQSVGGGAWMWDMPAPTRDMMVRYGATRETLYCPTNYDEMNQLGLWDFNVVKDGGGNVVGGYSVLGYAFMIRRYNDGTSGYNYPDTEKVTGTPTDGPVNNITQYAHWNYQASVRPKATPAPNGIGAYKTYVRPLITADTELAADAIISDPVDSTKFGGIQGGYSQPHHSSHQVGSKAPLGGNILFMDGHVTFRPLKQMLIRAKCSYGSNGAHFWW